MPQLNLAGWFNDDEGRWYAALAGSLPCGGTLVEVGAWKGRSASWAGPVCNARGVRFVLVDHFRGSTDIYANAYTELLRQQDVRAILETNLRILGIAYELLAMPSVEAATRFPPRSIDAVFLDASHDESSVAADLEAWGARVRKGGTIAGHDWSDDHPGLIRAVQRFAEQHELQIERGPGRLWRLSGWEPDRDGDCSKRRRNGQRWTVQTFSAA
jgi:hypothetical protein